MGYRSQNNWEDAERERIDSLRKQLPRWQRYNWRVLVFIAPIVLFFVMAFVRG